MILGFVLSSVRAGWYPSRGDRLTRAKDPLAFWVLTAIGVIFGAIFLLFSLGLAFQNGTLAAAS